MLGNSAFIDFVWVLLQQTVGFVVTFQSLKTRIKRIPYVSCFHRFSLKKNNLILKLIPNLSIQIKDKTQRIRINFFFFILIKLFILYASSEVEWSLLKERNKWNGGIVMENCHVRVSVSTRITRSICALARNHLGSPLAFKIAHTDDVHCAISVARLVQPLPFNDLLHAPTHTSVLYLEK